MIENMNWFEISQTPGLTEDFIREHKDLVCWTYISKYQKLSEDFIREHKDLVCWVYISTYQKLSEDFILEHKSLVNWYNISVYQKLSEDFIRENKDLVYWVYISEYQKLSEDFIREHKNLVNWIYISQYQKLSEDFIREFNLSIPTDNWLYISAEDKLSIVRQTNLYEIDGEYIIAYKGVRSDNYSKFNFQYKYEVGETYSCHADFNLSNENSFGLSAWTLEKAREYCNQKILKVKIHASDLAAVVHKGGKLRCQKFLVIK